MHKTCSDRQRKAETGSDMLEQAGYIGSGRDRQRKAETSRDMLGKAGHIL
jgi:hypothetical protein